MELSYEVLRDKVLGCWNGKNIGGVLGAPLEGQRQVNDVSFYLQDLNGNPPPNDDLDLQLVWLNAVERFGRQVNASVLGEYWLSYIIPFWVEYGTGKTNLAAGLVPPLSGHVENDYRNSCGCFIRSELWACLCPGHPELAARYAYEDAIVDHGGEGMYAEIFCAAMQSAAFVETDRDQLIEIGLSYIPENCAVAKAVRIALDCYGQNVSWKEARHRILSEVPGNFGIRFTKIKDIKDDYPYGEPGFDAPSNIGLMIIGWLYGENDFAKSLCIAVNCGEDTDCTAATLGAIFGIIYGDSGLPKEWKEPLGGVINTCCINRLNNIDIPNTVDELTDRVLFAIPGFLGRAYYNNGQVTTAEELTCETGDIYVPLTNGASKPKDLPIEQLLKLSPYAVKYDFPTFFAVLDYQGEPNIKLNEPRKLKLTLFDNGLTCHQQWANVKLYGPEGITFPQGTHFSAPLQSTYQYKIETEIELLAEAFHNSKIELLIDVSINARHTYGVIKAVLFPSF